VTTLFRALAVLPLWLLHGLGFLLGWIAFLGSPTYRRRFAHNAAQAGYAIGRVRGAIGAAGQQIAETPRLWFGQGAPVFWDDRDVVNQAMARGRGVIFLTPHLGCFEATAQAYASLFGPITVLYRPARKAWLRDLVDGSRTRQNLAAAPTTLAGVKQMLKALQAGQAVGLLPDQVPPQGLGAWAPFFGRSAYTMTLPARLAQQTGAALLLIWGERLAWGRGVRVHVRPWPGALPRDPTEAATAVNAQIEAMVRECPQQYLWGYARYKQPREAGA
jgi:KDO2-lipid IV(A) lauroyltransferase